MLSKPLSANAGRFAIPWQVSAQYTGNEYLALEALARYKNKRGSAVGSYVRSCMIPGRKITSITFDQHLTYVGTSVKRCLKCVSERTNWQTPYYESASN